MLDNIEAAFESGSYGWHYDEKETRKYARAFKGNTLEYIMEYIIKNDGEFPLPKRPIRKKAVKKLYF